MSINQGYWSIFNVKLTPKSFTSPPYHRWLLFLFPAASSSSAAPQLAIPASCLIRLQLLALPTKHPTTISFVRLSLLLCRIQSPALCLLHSAAAWFANQPVPPTAPSLSVLPLDYYRIAHLQKRIQYVSHHEKNIRSIRTNSVKQWVNNISNGYLRTLDSQYVSVWFLQLNHWSSYTV